MSNRQTGLRTAIYVTVTLMIAVAPSARAQPHHVGCPNQAPTEWGLHNPAPLEQAAVLSQPAGESIDDNAPPSLVPDRGYGGAGVWHNIWRMKDEPGWSHFIDCQYRGSTRILRIKADGLTHCEQTAQPYSAKRGIADKAVQTMICW